MRLTFRIKKWTVTILVRETSQKKAKIQHDKKSAATPRK